jgi:hypothetical protein
MVLITLIASCLAAPMIKEQMFVCVGVCRDDWNNSVKLFDSTAVTSFVKTCVGTKSNYSEIQRDIFLQSVHGSCTPEKYAMMDQALAQVTEPSITTCIATCGKKPAEPTVSSLQSCIESLGTVSTRPDSTFLKSYFQLQGQCSFEIYNEIQRAIRDE